MDLFPIRLSQISGLHESVSMDNTISSCYIRGLRYPCPLCHVILIRLEPISLDFWLVPLLWRHGIMKATVSLHVMVSCCVGICHVFITVEWTKIVLRSMYILLHCQAHLALSCQHHWYYIFSWCCHMSASYCHSDWQTKAWRWLLILFVNPVFQDITYSVLYEIISETWRAWVGAGAFVWEVIDAQSALRQNRMLPEMNVIISHGCLENQGISPPVESRCHLISFQRVSMYPIPTNVDPYTQQWLPQISTV